MPWSHSYQNEFEKQVIMAINLFRNDPKKWLTAIEDTYKHAPELKKHRKEK